MIYFNERVLDIDFLLINIRYFGCLIEVGMFGSYVFVCDFKILVYVIVVGIREVYGFGSYVVVIF